MTSPDVTQQLKAGIAAAKAGNRQEAHQLLLDVLRADEENELAWLWLSGVVTNEGERRICLENVLTLNPDNQIAQRGLAKLGLADKESVSPPEITTESEEKVMRREYVPFSPASAILYPEHQVQEVRWHEPKIPQKAVQAEIRQASSYDDVWSRNVDICAYCAQELAFDTVQCPKCKRNLNSKRFTYEKASSSLHIYWVLLVGLGQLFLIEAIVNVILGPNYMVAVGYLLLLVLLWGLAAGVYFRQSWAHLISLIALLIILTAFLLNSVVEVDYAALGLAALDSSIKTFVSSFIGDVLKFLTTFEVATAVLALVYGIFKAGPDFERKQTRLTASITGGRRTAPDYHNIARHLSEKGLWASAILHWQRAAAQEPGQVAYQKQLGLAYARLGFYQRSRDVLQSAHDMSTHPPTKAELAKHLRLVEEQLAAQQGETAVT
jgi:tetratricopeptide (TPR) repeat protein